MADLLPYSLLPYGPDAWLVQLDDPENFDLLLEMRNQPHESIVEAVIGYDSLLLRTRGSVDEAQLLKILNSDKKSAAQAPRHHKIHVDYNGPDLADVSNATGLSREEVISLHSGSIYSVRLLGFSPGFAYLDGLPPELQLPRREVPRTKMAAGAVASGGAHAGIYTIPSPGGWNWLGHTDHSLFNPSIDGVGAFTLQPGDTLEFIPTA